MTVDFVTEGLEAYFTLDKKIVMFKTLFFAKSILTILIAQNLRWIRAHLALFLAVHFFFKPFLFLC